MMKKLILMLPLLALFGCAAPEAEAPVLKIDGGLVQGVVAEKKSECNNWYTIDGRQLSNEPSRSGIYINDGKKKIVR